MTWVEVRDEIDAYNRRKQIAAKEQERLMAITDYQLAQLIGVIVHDPKKYPRNLSAAYPGWFEEDWRANKSKFAQYADEFNRRKEAKK